MIFPVVMYECDSWTIKKVDHQIIGALGFFLQHQNMYIIKGETDHQPRLDA